MNELSDDERHLLRCYAETERIIHGPVRGAVHQHHRERPGGDPWFESEGQQPERTSSHSSLTKAAQRRLEVMHLGNRFMGDP